MRSFLKTWFHKKVPFRRPHRARPELESLEDRQLLSTVLRLNMNSQPAGNDGVADTISVRRFQNSGGPGGGPIGEFVEIHVNNVLFQRVLYHNVSSVSIIGSGDIDSVTVDGSLGMPVEVDTNGGFDTLLVNGTTAPDTIEVLDGTVHVTGIADTVVSYNDVNALTVNAGSNSDSLFLKGTKPGVQTQVNGGAGDDDFFIDPAARAFAVNGGEGSDELVGMSTHNNRFDITGAGSGNHKLVVNGGLIDTTSFSSVEDLKGASSRDDTFRFLNGGSIAGSVSGLGGLDALDYSGRSSGVFVDLTAQQATGVGASVFGIRNVIGTAADDFIRGNAKANELYGFGGNDILIGMDGADRLEALATSTGRSLLIGGRGTDTVLGGGGQDILIADHTQYDQDNEALQGIHNFWRFSDLYPDRVDDLRAGILIGPNARFVRLNTATVLNELSSADTLTGRGGQDWFWALEGATVTDKASNEELN